MRDNHLNRFLSNPLNRTGLLLLSILLSVVVAGMSATSWLEVRNERLASEFGQSRIDALRTHAAELGNTLARIQAKVAQLNNMLLHRGAEESFREDIIGTIRSAQCQVRNLSVGQRHARSWMEGDRAGTDGAQFDDFDAEAFPTGFLLESQRLSLSVDGTWKDVRRLLAQIQSIDKLFHTESLRIDAGAADIGGTLSLKWDLTLYDLVEDESFNNEDYFE